MRERLAQNMRAREKDVDSLASLVIAALWAVFREAVPALDWWPRGAPGTAARWALFAASAPAALRLSRGLVYEPAGEDRRVR